MTPMSTGPEPIPRTAEFATLTDDDLVTGEAVALLLHPRVLFAHAPSSTPALEPRPGVEAERLLVVG